jgi:hypothetical protein
MYSSFKNGYDFLKEKKNYGRIQNISVAFTEVRWKIAGTRVKFQE